MTRSNVDSLTEILLGGYSPLIGYNHKRRNKTTNRLRPHHPCSCQRPTPGFRKTLRSVPSRHLPQLQSFFSLNKHDISQKGRQDRTTHLVTCGDIIGVLVITQLDEPGEPKTDSLVTLQPLCGLVYTGSKQTRRGQMGQVRWICHRLGRRKVADYQGTYGLRLRSAHSTSMTTLGSNHTSGALEESAITSPLLTVSSNGFKRS